MLRPYQINCSARYVSVVNLISTKHPREIITWWRRQMETFSALLAICAGNSPVTALLAICVENSPVTGEFPAQRPVRRSFDVFCDLHLNKRLSKKSWGRWFETPSRPLCRHCNDQPCRFLHNNNKSWITQNTRYIFVSFWHITIYTIRHSYLRLFCIMYFSHFGRFRRCRIISTRELQCFIKPNMFCLILDTYNLSCIGYYERACQAFDEWHWPQLTF